MDKWAGAVDLRVWVEMGISANSQGDQGTYYLFMAREFLKMPHNKGELVFVTIDDTGL